MNELALFAGAGGGILGGHLLGWRTVCAVEIEDYPRRVLLQRQRDGILPRFPIWDDITTFDGRPWKGRVDIVSGGFPCQDISAAGKGAGIEGERSGLWGEMARVVDEVRPRFVFVENSPMLTSRGLGVVLGDLAEMGYYARWCVLGADDAGAPHRRKRIWILAYARSRRCIEQREREVQQQGRARIVGTGKDVADSRQEYERKGNTARMETDKRERTSCSIHNQSGGEGFITWWDKDPADLPDTDSERLPQPPCGQLGFVQETNGTPSGSESCRRDAAPAQRERRPTQPTVGRVAHGVAHRVDRLKAIGNGQVPAVAAIAFTILSEGIL